MVASTDRARTQDVDDRPRTARSASLARFPSISRVVSFISAAGAARRVARVPRSPRRLGAPARRERGIAGMNCPSDPERCDGRTPDRADALPSRGYDHVGCPRRDTPIIVPPKDRTPEQRARGRGASPTAPRPPWNSAINRAPRGALASFGEMTDQERKLGPTV